jgi:sugar lactone lactonase YvrE
MVKCPALRKLAVSFLRYGTWTALPPALLLWTTVLTAVCQQPADGVPSPTSPLYPLALAVDGQGRVYLADRNLPGVWVMESESPRLFFHGSRKFRTPLNAVRCLAVDRQGRLLAGDSSTRQIYRFDDQGLPQPLAQPWDSEHNLGPLGIPMGIVQNSQGELVVSDLEFHCLWKIPAEGGNPVKWAEIQAPTGLAIDNQDRVWVVSRVESPLRRVAPDGTVSVVVSGRPFEFPHSVALDDDGNAYVVDGYRKTVWKVSPDGTPQEWLTHERLVNPVDIKRHADGLYLVDPRAKVLLRIGWDKSVKLIELASDAK